ncbi:MAG: acyl--CoA ligase [Leptospiraceae bacterium]|nr:acyl--CoA ligase [Leptospiraceae bacterium]MCP5495215.1 acyl--CoA ligase [Leptospiraceae bacterium]
MDKILSSLPTNPGESWKKSIYLTLKDKPYPIFIFKNTIVPAASVWSGMRVWVDFFRSMGLNKGTRILLSLPPSPGFLYIFFASFWEGFSLAIQTVPNKATYNTETEKSLIHDYEETDSHILISNMNFSFNFLLVNSSGLPGEKNPKSLSLRKTKNPLNSEIRLLLKTSGSSGNGKWVALSDRSIASVLQSHIPELDVYQKRVLSILPWGHAFGLVIDLLVAIFSRCEIVRDKSDGKNIKSILDNINNFSINYLCCVPKTIQDLMSHPIGEKTLKNLKGGVIGGAPVSEKMAYFLKKTQFRVGYGQTEASPGILLGKQGVWEERFIGYPVGCEARLSDSDELEFFGKNIALGYWSTQGLESFPQNEWQKTGDLAQKKSFGYVFMGRKDDRIKLPNGYFLDLETVERKIINEFSGIETIMLYFTKEGTLCIYYSSDTIHLERDKIKDMIKVNPYKLEMIPKNRFYYNKKGSLNRKATIDAILNFQNTGLKL